MDYAQFTTILDNRVKTIFPVVAPDVNAEYTQYMNRVDYDQNIYQLTGVTGLGMGQVLADGQTPSIDYPLQGFTKVAAQLTFTHRVRLGYKASQFLFGDVLKAGSTTERLAKIDATVEKQVLDLKNAITHVKNFLAQSMLANGWSTSFTFTPLANGVTEYQRFTIDTTTADGVQFWSTAHAREDGGTAWGNVIISGTNNPTFSYSALVAARGQHAAKKDGRGLPLIGSTIDTLMFQINSPAYFLAKSINATIERGYYPSANPGASGSFVDAPSTDGFKIIPLNVYGGSGVTSVMWFGFDSSKVNKNFGFQYVVTMDATSLPTYQDLSGNLDLIMNMVEFSTFMVADLRYWMASNGTNA